MLLLLAVVVLLMSCGQALPAGAEKTLRIYIQEQASDDLGRIHQATPISRYGLEGEWCVWVESPSQGEQPRLAAYYLVKREGAWEVAMDPLVAPDGWSLWKYDLQCPMVEQTQ